MNYPIFIEVTLRQSNPVVSEKRMINVNYIRSMQTIEVKGEVFTMIDMPEITLKVTETPEQIKNFTEASVRNYARMIKLTENGFMV